MGARRGWVKQICKIVRPGRVRCKLLWWLAPPFLKGGWSRGFEWRATRLRNGIPVHRNTRPARLEGITVLGILQMLTYATTENPPQSQ